MVEMLWRDDQRAAALESGRAKRDRRELPVDENGRLTLPPDVARQLGAWPGEAVTLEMVNGSVRLCPALTHLAKVYVEPTARCNLACRTCVRNSWSESLGDMEWPTFERVLAGLRSLPTPPRVVFAGFGEPLSHPRILDMIAAVKATGARAEMVTNATLLDESVAQALIDVHLDWMWVSLDGTRPESYDDVRLGATLPVVLANLERLRSLHQKARAGEPRLGVVFVAMKRNIGDLPELLELARQLGAERVMVSNVAPHTAAMCQEVLYASTLADAPLIAPGQPRVSLPLMDASEATREPLYQLLRRLPDIAIGDASLAERSNRCPFVEAGATAVGWDGGVSPCPPLMHSYTTYLNRQARDARRYVVGNLKEQGLPELWQEEGYLAFRERVRRFDFAPCVSCGVCYLAESNEDDCFGSGFPSCGGCPWAQGVIQCP